MTTPTKNKLELLDAITKKDWYVQYSWPFDSVTKLIKTIIKKVRRKSK